jgi:hypothetical protein
MWAQADELGAFQFVVVAVSGGLYQIFVAFQLFVAS